MSDKALMRVDCIVGARPNFVKIAPIMRVLKSHTGVAVRLIHTGQHYDIAMNEVFFEELGIPLPDVNLEVGSGTNTQQTARIMLGLEPVLADNRPDMLVVVGDVNSTIAATLVASKLLIPVCHVEAGLRSNDRTMPEEINRLVTDRLSDLLLTTEREAGENLVREGVEPQKIHFVGNVMIDTLRASIERAVPAATTIAEYEPSGTFAAAAKQGYGFVTLHRPSNVDDPTTLTALVEALVAVSRKLPLVFPVHPRTRSFIDAAGLGKRLSQGRILATPPLSYLTALGLMREAKLAITDSGGVQEETTALGVPCITMRDNTERPVTVTEGTNDLIGSAPSRLPATVDAILSTGGKSGRIPEYWDGRAAERIVQHVLDAIEKRRA